MEVFGEDFQFALEMVILNRNENGATLAEIRDDFENYFGIDFEAIVGYKCWEQMIRPMLSGVMFNITSKTVGRGCVLYYMNIDAAIKKLSSNLSEGMELICETLKINLSDLKKFRDETIRSQSRSMSTSQSDSTGSSHPKSVSSTSSTDCELYGHLLISDNFFLELAHKELKCQPLDACRVKQIGHCVSGQSIRKAAHNISLVINQIYQEGAIINLGSIDLLQGRELIDMMTDMRDLCTMLLQKGIFPVVTTLAPLANQMHNTTLENKRKLFNSFLSKYYDCIDTERCFLSYFGRILFEKYQSEPKPVSGTRCPLVLWNGVGRKNVLKMLKRKIPEIHGYYCS